MKNKYNVAEHTVKHFAKNPEMVKRYIKICKRKKHIGSLEQWLYIAYRIGILNKDDKEKVVFT